MLLSPVFNIGEMVSMLTTEKKFFHMLTIQTPLYVKIIKDIGFLMIIILSLFGLKKLGRDKVKLFILFFTPLAILTAVSFVMACRTSLLQAMAGLRWIMPIFLAVFMIGNADDNLMRKMAKAITVVFFISFFIQFYESFMIKGSMRFSGDMIAFLRSWWSRKTYASGIFTMYNTAGLFACETLFLVYFYMKKSRLRLLTLSLIPVNLLLASSGTGFPTYVLANYLIWVKGKINKTTIAVFILIAVLLVYLLPIVISRPGISGNLTGRAKLCFKSFREAGLFSKNFGKGTNAMVLFSQKFGTPNMGQILDSTVTGIVVNTGRIGLVMALSSYITWLALVLRSKRLDAMIFTLIYTLFSLTVPITEAFPMSLILAVGLGYFTPIILLKNKNSKTG
jgi:hypothetical protein